MPFITTSPGSQQLHLESLSVPSQGGSLLVRNSPQLFASSIAPDPPHEHSISLFSHSGAVEGKLSTCCLSIGTLLPAQMSGSV